VGLIAEKPSDALKTKLVPVQPALTLKNGRYTKCFGGWQETWVNMCADTLVERVHDIDMSMVATITYKDNQYNDCQDNAKHFNGTLVRILMPYTTVGNRQDAEWHWANTSCNMQTSLNNANSTCILGETTPYLIQCIQLYTRRTYKAVQPLYAACSHV